MGKCDSHSIYTLTYTEVAGFDSFFFFFLSFIYFERDRDRDSEHESGRVEREGKRESQAGCQRRAHPLSHPGSPDSNAAIFTDGSFSGVSMPMCIYIAKKRTLH